MSYQGKEVLRIWDFVTEFEQWKQENIYSLPIIGQLRRMYPPTPPREGGSYQFSPFGHLLAIFAKIENSDFGKIVKIYLQSLHGINRAFNSYTYSDLITAANTQLNTLTFTKNELSLFQRTKQADSYLDQDFLNLQLKEKSINIPTFVIPRVF